MACRRGTCLCAALLFSFVGHAAASECPAGSGLCRELQEEAPASIGLVQSHADRAPLSHLAMQRQQAAESSEQLPDALTNLIPQPFKDYLGNVAVQGILTALNTSLDAITTQADSLLDSCNEYKADIISTINRTISQNLEDGVATLQAMANERLVPISGTWTSIVNLFQAVGPPVVTGLNGLNFTSTAASVNQVYTKLMSAAEWISGLLANSTTSISKLSNTTAEEKEFALQKLDATLDDGMTSVTDFTDSLKEMTTRLLASLAKVVNDNATIPPIQSKVDALAGTVGDSLETVLSGTREAADLAVRGIPSAAAALRVWLGLALAAACTGLSPALRGD